MRTSLIRRAAASLLALSLVSAAPLAVQAQEDETPRVECACNFSGGSKDKLL